MTYTKNSDFDKIPVKPSYGAGLFAVPTVLKAVYVLVLFYTILVSQLVNTKWYAMWIYYWLGMIAFYVWHWTNHHKFWWNATAFEMHAKHHWVYYPPKHMFGTAELEKLWKINQNNLIEGTGMFGSIRHLLPGYSGITHELLLYVFAFWILFGSYLFGVQIPTIVAALIGYVMMGLIANYLHESTHVKGHFLEQFDWFQQLRVLHFIHHQGNAKRNFAVINMTLDKLLGTYISDYEDKQKDEELSMEDIPEGISKEHLMNVVSPRRSLNGNTVLMRLIVIMFFTCLWFESQAYLWTTPNLGKNRQIIDHVHDYLEPVNHWLLTNPGHADTLIFASGVVVDVFTGWMILMSLFGKSFRPFLGLVVLFTLRQLCQLMVSFPAPSNMLWRDPGFPSLFVTYQVSNDFYFSGHVASCTLAGIEIVRHWSGSKSIGLLLSICLILFECFAVLSLRTHYITDVTAALIAGRYASMLAARHGEAIDALFP